MATGHRHTWEPVKVLKKDRLRCSGCGVVIEAAESTSAEHKDDLAREEERKSGRYQ